MRAQKEHVAPNHFVIHFSLRSAAEAALKILLFGEKYAFGELYGVYGASKKPKNRCFPHKSGAKRQICRTATVYLLTL